MALNLKDIAPLVLAATLSTGCIGKDQPVQNSDSTHEVASVMPDSKVVDGLRNEIYVACEDTREVARKSTEAAYGFSNTLVDRISFEVGNKAVQRCTDIGKACMTTGLKYASDDNDVSTPAEANNAIIKRVMMCMSHNLYTIKKPN